MSWGIGKGGRNDYVFIVCAAIGGTILVVNSSWRWSAWAAMPSRLDVPSDIGHDFGGDFHGDAAAICTAMAAFTAITPAATRPTAIKPATMVPLGCSAFFRFARSSRRWRFSASAGLAAQSAEASPPTACGGAGGRRRRHVRRLLDDACLYTLRADGTVRIQRAIGQHGNVYLRIPANRSGSGKIQFNLQNRTMEYLAVTAGQELPTGAKVVVVGVVNPTTLEVQAE